MPDVGEPQNRRFTLTLRHRRETARTLRAKDRPDLPSLSACEAIPHRELVSSSSTPVPASCGSAPGETLVRKHRRFEPFETGRDRLGAKQLAGIVKDERRDDG